MLFYNIATPWFIYQFPTNGHLGWFPIFVIYDAAEVNIPVK